MSKGADVVATVRFTPESVRRLKQLTEEAVRQAIRNTRDRLEALAAKYTPVRTGRLLSSFDIAFTPRHIAMKFDPVDPDTGFHYAKVVEEGRGPPRAFSGRYYAEALAFEAPIILEEELGYALAAQLGGTI